MEQNLLIVPTFHIVGKPVCPLEGSLRSFGVLKHLANAGHDESSVGNATVPGGDSHCPIEIPPLGKPENEVVPYLVLHAPGKPGIFKNILEMPDLQRAGKSAGEDRNKFLLERKGG